MSSSSQRRNYGGAGRGLAMVSGAGLELPSGSPATGLQMTGFLSDGIDGDCPCFALTMIRVES